MIFSKKTLKVKTNNRAASKYKLPLYQIVKKSRHGLSIIFEFFWRNNFSDEGFYLTICVFQKQGSASNTHAMHMNFHELLNKALVFGCTSKETGVGFITLVLKSIALFIFFTKQREKERDCQQLLHNMISPAFCSLITLFSKNNNFFQHLQLTQL